VEIVWTILSFLLILGGVVGSVLPVIPGPPLAFAGLMLMHFLGVGEFSTLFLVITGVVVLAVTIGDFILPSAMTKKFGGSKAASVGSFLGLLVGTIFFPPFGMIAGSFLGALGGELLVARSEGVKAFRVAMGSLLAFILGTGAKLLVCGVVLFYAIRALF